MFLQLVKDSYFVNLVGKLDYISLPGVGSLQLLYILKCQSTRESTR